MLTAQQELDRFLDRSAAIFAEALLQIGKAPRPTSGVSYYNSLEQLATLIKNTMVMADLSGRKRLFMELDYAKRRRPGKFAAGSIEENTPLNQNLTFDEAVDRILNSEPRIIPSMKEVARAYSQEKVFAMARSAAMKVTTRVQEEVGKLIQGGASGHDVENAVLNIGQSAEMGSVRDWTRAYAATVYRTNAATSYNEGRLAQAADPEVKEIIPAFEYVGVNDAFTRHNHRAAFGAIAPQEHQVWTRLRPPNGYQCRCGLNYVSRFEMERRGLVDGNGFKAYFPPGFENAHPDKGFEVKRVNF